MHTHLNYEARHDADCRRFSIALIRHGEELHQDCRDAQAVGVLFGALVAYASPEGPMMDAERFDFAFFLTIILINIVLLFRSHLTALCLLC